ncbi:MAG: helix-turn-helix domain-containing protein [Alphaproteobacteria bacterium]|nr:helix-turn-helix domain-containing protein [Alphaproteobacteria bacterium]
MSESSIQDWLKSEGRTAISLAAALGISKGHLSHIMAGRFRASAELAVKIERETGGAVPRVRLRPDLFADFAKGEAA